MTNYKIAYMVVVVPDIEYADKVFVDILRLKKERGDRTTAVYILNKNTELIVYKINKTMKNYPTDLQLTTSTKNILTIKKRLENDGFFFQRELKDFKKPINLFSYSEDKDTKGNIFRILNITFLYTWGHVTLGD